MACKPGTTYWYRFIAPDGGKSPVGRTKTLPVGDVDRFGLGLFSCSNLPMGWFNAYAHAAARDDLDLWLHVGDYLYEYGIASYQDKDRVAGREVMPAHDHEMIALIDYRLRFACYRADPDLQKLHQMAPMVALWDDHEITNDSWEGGASNHQPQSEGDWNARRAAAMQAYREWLPVSDEPWKAYPIGTLATLYRTESRLLARTRPAIRRAGRGAQASNPTSRCKRSAMARGAIRRRRCSARRRNPGWRTQLKRNARSIRLADGRHGNDHRTHRDAGRTCRTGSARRGASVS